MTVGSASYPEPAAVIVNPVTTPAPLIDAVAVAPEPWPSTLVIVTEGGAR